MILESFSRLSDSMILWIQPKTRGQITLLILTLLWGGFSMAAPGISHTWIRWDQNSSWQKHFGIHRAEMKPQQLWVRKYNGFFHFLGCSTSTFTGGNWDSGGWDAQLLFQRSDLLVWRLRSSTVPHKRRKMSRQDVSWMFRSPELILSAHLSCWEMPGFKQG